MFYTQNFSPNFNYLSFIQFRLNRNENNCKKLNPGFLDSMKKVGLTFYDYRNSAVIQTLFYFFRFVLVLVWILEFHHFRNIISIEHILNLIEGQLIIVFLILFIVYPFVSCGSCESTIKFRHHFRVESRKVTGN